MSWTYNASKRIENKELLIEETKAYYDYMDENNCTISWNFTKKDANEKLAKHYAEKQTMQKN
ncbi:MAG: hypothetical protein LBB45_05890 [Methanobrevibacter sp.]|jgi:hypothetical protein|nr:hypothetical protein [Candidatus Methanovirga basalitermitum]